MTARVSGGRSGVRALGAAACVAMGLAALGGCASSSADTMTGMNERGAIDTGTYPNLNIPPESAADPITPADKRQMYQKLGAARKTQAANAKATKPQANAALLKRLAEEHASDTLAAIEKK